jgi:AraC-like DNA-binding protein
MTLGIKDMIARCIARMRRSECETCVQRDSCVLHKMGAFAAPPPAASPVSSILGAIAKAVVAAVERPSAFRLEVEGRIEALLETGEARIDRVASDLGLSRQTLYRRLKDEGVTFEDLLDTLRHRLALRYLRQEKMSVKGASYRLGFSDPAAFSRAFKRWTGASPRAAMA